MATTPTQLRLTESDRAKLATLQEWYGLPSLAAAVRTAVEWLHREGPPPRPKARPKVASPRPGRAC